MNSRVTPVLTGLNFLTFVECDAMDDYGYLQHGQGTAGPFRTERVRVKPDSWPHTGQWLAWFEGKWRRVHVQVNRTYIVHQGERITIQIEGV